MAVYSRDLVTAGTNLDVSISGTAPTPSAGGDQGQDAAQPANGRDSGVPVAAIPPRLDTLKWVLIGGFSAIFLLGGIYLWRRPTVAAAGSEFLPAPAVSNGPVRGTRSPMAAPAASAGGATSTPAAATSLAAMDREANVSLDELKDMIFRLELRRQAGTISEQEYSEQRAKAEKIIRDLVRG